MSKHGIVRTANVTGTTAPILGPSTQRTALLFSPPTTAGSSYTVSTDPNVALGGGLNIGVGGMPILVTEALFGDAVQKTWYAVGSGSFAVGFLETVAD